MANIFWVEIVHLITWGGRVEEGGGVVPLVPKENYVYEFLLTLKVWKTISQNQTDWAVNCRKVVRSTKKAEALVSRLIVLGFFPNYSPLVQCRIFHQNAYHLPPIFHYGRKMIHSPRAFFERILANCAILAKKKTNLTENFKTIKL